MLYKEEFWDRIYYEPSDLSKAVFFIEHRGIDAHIYILNYLESMKSGKISYSEIATAMRYDKRIRRIIYKYIGFLEEHIRSFISNRYRKNINGFNHTKILKKLLKTSEDLFSAIEMMNLGQLIYQVKILSENDQADLFPTCSYTFKSLDAVRVFRNEVGHNRFLLNNLSLQAPQGENPSLYANITNLYDYLPEGLRSAFKDEINSARNSIGQKEYQTKWNLIDEITIHI